MKINLRTYAFSPIGPKEKSPLGVKGRFSFNIDETLAKFFNITRISVKLLRNAAILIPVAARHCWLGSHIVLVWAELLRRIVLSRRDYPRKRARHPWPLLALDQSMSACDDDRRDHGEHRATRGRMASPLGGG
mgnify:CR=1